MEKYLDVIKSVVIGHAVADAVGVPVEFKSREKLDSAPVTDMREFGTHNMPKGTWSDDTSMLLATLDSLAGGTVDYEDIMEKFAAWCTKDAYTVDYMFDIGRTCLVAITRSFSSRKVPALECGLDDEGSNGNGSLMRIAPFVLYSHIYNLSLPERIELIKNGSALTHAHDRSKMGCLIFAFVLEELIKNQSKDSIARGLSLANSRLNSYPEFTPYKRIFEPRFADTPREKIKSSGYVVDTLEAALWCVLTTDDYKSCVLKAVNLGDDTDTVAAVAGSLAGLLYGYDNIPEEWRRDLKKRDYIEDMCTWAYMSWTH